MNQDEMIKLLQKECVKAGSQKAWAKKNNMSQPYVCDVLQGKRAMGKTIAKALGYKIVISFVKEKKNG